MQLNVKGFSYLPPIIMGPKSAQHYLHTGVIIYKVTQRVPLGCTWSGIFLSLVKSLSRVRLFATSWTVAYQAPWSMGFSRQEYWSGLPFPSPGYLPNPGIKPGSPALQTDALPSEPLGKPQGMVLIPDQE